MSFALQASLSELLMYVEGDVMALCGWNKVRVCMGFVGRLVGLV